LGVERRWLDTTIAQNEIDGVRRERQGISRAISPSAVLVLAVALRLIDALQMPVSRALTLARSLVVDAGTHSPARELTVHVDVAEFERRMAVRLAEAVATHPPPRRGRPLRAKKNGTP